MRKLGKRAREWSVEAPGGSVRYIFLCWDDIIRRRWITSPLTLLAASCRAYARYCRFSSLRHAFMMGSNAAVALFYPLLIGGGQALAGLCAIALIWCLPAGGAGIKWAASAGVAAAAVALCARAAKKHKLGWLLRIYVFGRAYAAGEAPEACARAKEFAEIIRREAENAEETLLVGHSVGSILAYETAALLLKDGAMPEGAKLLTIGQCVPLVAGLPEGKDFCERMRPVLASNLRRIDVSSPADGACVAMRDPMAWLPGLPCPALPAAVSSPKFHRIFSPARYKALRRDRFLLHFAYLFAPDNADGFDYFRVVTE